MKTKREELIDFFKWLSEEYGYMVNHVVKSEVVDEYLKSINSNASPESPNVRTNEAKENKCYRVNKWPTCPHEVNELDCQDCACYF